MAPGRHTRRTFIQRGALAGTAVAAGGIVLPSPGAFGRPASRALRGGRWLPGDLHTHSVYSHDVYGGPTDDNTGPEEMYTLGLPVAGKFAEGRARGLRFLSVSDHNDVRSAADLASASQGVIPVPAYEHSLRGHAHMLGATRIYDEGDQAADAVNAMAADLRAAGGVFQANHPAYRVAGDAEYHSCGATSCAECSAINWTYGFDVPPDTIEVWNRRWFAATSPRRTGSAGSTAVSASAAPVAATRTGWRCTRSRGQVSRRPGSMRRNRRRPASSRACARDGQASPAGRPRWADRA